MGNVNWKTQPPVSCACSQLRRASRAVSRFYDDALAPAGLTITQYALLARIGRADGVSRTVLAEQIGMDRTTLTRNLRPLERENLVKEETGEDRRARLLRLTVAGTKKMEYAYPLWESAQRRFIEKFGAQHLNGFYGFLQRAGSVGVQPV